MKIKYVTLEECSKSTGTVVVIDVLRAFTVSAFALNAGAVDLILTGSVDEAMVLKRCFPQALLMGEMNGLPIPGFDVGNSPSAIIEMDVKGRRIIHRTSAGTQGVVLSKNADTLFVASFVCALATVRALRRLIPDQVTFVNTGIFPPRDGDEDIACSDYMSLLLQNQEPDLNQFKKRVRNSYSGRLFSQSNQPEYPQADLEMALQVDRFSFAQKIIKQDGLLVVQPYFDTSIS